MRMGDEVEQKRPTQGLAWRMAASFILGLLWFTFLIIWLFFFAIDYTFYQNLAMLLLSSVVALGFLIAIWLLFGLRLARQVRGIDPDWQGEGQKWLGWRATGSIVVWAIWFGFLIIWLFFFAGDKDPFQNAAIIIISLVLVGGLSAVFWSPFRRN